MTNACLRSGSYVTWRGVFVVAAANLKAGTGKTTIATHLGAAFAVAGHRTALGDLDKLQVASACARPGTVPAVPTSH